MRISSNPQDPSFHPEHYNYDVYLDGVKVMFCLTADEELGFVICFFMPLVVRNELGLGDEVSKFEQKGAVRIVQRKENEGLIQ